MEWFFLLSLTFATMVVPGISELYSAMASLEALLDTQKAVINTLDHYIDQSRRKIEELQKLRKEYETLYNISSSKFQDFISNPINAFVLMKKLSMDWNETRSSLNYLFDNDTDIENLNVVFPDYEDISGAAKALLRVQQTYGLNTTALSEGVLPGVSRGLELSADDCFELGRQAFHAGYFQYALSWMERARNKSNTNNGVNSSVKELDISSLVKEENSFNLLTSSIMQLGYMMSPYMAEEFSTGLSLENADSNTRFTSQMTFLDEATYRQLCQNQKDETMLALASRMKCRLVHHHPYFKLQPVREEELWSDPKISLFHDVFSDREIEILKSLALPILERAEVAEYTDQLGHRVSDTRVTKIAWLEKEDHPLIPKLYNRIELITGLSSQTAEPFQMANYGLGGHFHLHMDVLPDTEKYYGPDRGNRIATWLTYMSDVSAGGATVFPRLNLTVWPKKGSALFWHNIKSNGLGNILTLHGACPVVTGSKWVTNVWFHERDQEFRLKCGKHPESSLQPAEFLKMV